MRNRLERCVAGLILSIAFPLSALAERLPLKSFSTADGLPHNTINRIVRDSRGFLWLCTEEGLSRFDGYTFTNYGVEHGLPHSSINDLLETRAGEFWVATNGGLVRFNPKGTPSARVVYADDAASASLMFTTFVPKEESRQARGFSVLREGRDGTIWGGTFKGLYRLERNGAGYTLNAIELGMPSETPMQRFVSDLLDDRHGSLWIATPSGLYRRWPDGSVARYVARDGLPDEHLHDLYEDHKGRLWGATRNAGFFQFVADATKSPPIIARKYQQWDGLTTWVYQLFETSDHRFWVASNRGLAEFFPERTENQFRAYTERSGLIYREITALGEDAGSNLWLGSYAGAMKLARNGFVTYDETDGLLTALVFGDRAGGVCFRGSLLDPQKRVFESTKVDLPGPGDTYPVRFGRFEGQHFTWFEPHAPKIKKFGWVGEGLTLQARRGEWWIGTGEGLYRYPATDDFTRLQTTRPIAVYQTKEGISSPQQVFRIFEDSRGEVWASTIASPNGLARWDHTTETLQRDLANSPGLPSPTDDLARSFGEDRAGNVWIGFGGGVARYRRDRFDFFTTNQGLPAGTILYIYSDRKGRLWLASARSGLIRVDDPTAERPMFQSYTTAQGLSSNSTSVITEDLSGRIYVGTGRGLDRLDPETGRVKHFTTADGLAGGDILAAFCDRDGVLWVGARKGLSRFVPGTETPAAPPPIMLTRLLVAGDRQSISVLGESNIFLPDLAPDRNQLQIDFVGLSFAPGEVLRYQYQLEGADRDWSPPVEQRTVTYARLAPGNYRFLVRAVNSDGFVSTAPAALTFTVLPPIWQRWWLVALVSIAIGLIVYSLYRYRVARLLELANIRTRIATDLHDDIGANLTRISMLSEVARQQHGNGSDGADSPLRSIARIARESVASMSDIVWAINPERDSLLDVIRKMRRHAEEVFSLRDVELRFDAPSVKESQKLGVTMRRDLLLIFKEAINNVARHSNCSRVNIELRIEGSQVLLTIVDDGIGFDTSVAGVGHGLASMKRRADTLGGTLEIISAPGQTRVRATIPLSPPRRISTHPTSKGR